MRLLTLSIIARWIMASELAGRVSWSRTSLWWNINQMNVISTTRLRLSTWKPLVSGFRGTTSALTPRVAACSTNLLLKPWSPEDSYSGVVLGD